MNAYQVRELVEAQIGDGWATTNHHGVDLRSALVTPEKIKVIERSVRSGKLRDRLVEVWLVLVEKTDAGTGYKIVFREQEAMFGLASEGFPKDEYLVLCGWYGDFMSTFQGM
jgi:hypothetical protein